MKTLIVYFSYSNNTKNYIALSYCHTDKSKAHLLHIPYGYYL